MIPEPEYVYDMSLTETPPSTHTSLPFSKEAEEACCGVVLIDPTSYFELSAFLKAGDFYIQRNGYIWTAYGTLHDKRIPIDLLTVSQELEHQGVLAEIGGSAYITSLISQVPSSLNAESYGRIVEAMSIRRKMITSANKIATLAYNPAIPVETAYAEGRRSYDGAFSQAGQFKTIGELVSKEYDRIDARAEGLDDNIIPTGFVDLDKMLDGGMRGGNLILGAGRPGMGKTALMLDIAKHAAKVNGKHVAIFSLEMSNEQVTQRLIVKESGIPMSSLRTGRLSEREWPLFTHAVEKYADVPIYMDDMPALNPTQIRAKAHQLNNRFGIDLLIVDYLQLMGSDTNIDNRVQEVSAISRSLKVLARELNIPIFAGAQLSRKVEERQDKRPILSDLRDSGSLEQDADVVMFLYRDNMYDSKTEHGNGAELIVAKQRDGGTGTVNLIFRGPQMKFENASMRVFSPNEPDTRRVDIHGDD